MAKTSGNTHIEQIDPLFRLMLDSVTKNVIKTNSNTSNKNKVTSVYTPINITLLMRSSILNQGVSVIYSGNHNLLNK